MLSAYTAHITRSTYQRCSSGALPASLVAMTLLFNAARSDRPTDRRRLPPKNSAMTRRYPFTIRRICAQEMFDRKSFGVLLLKKYAGRLFLTQRAREKPRLTCPTT